MTKATYKMKDLQLQRIRTHCAHDGEHGGWQADRHGSEADAESSNLNYKQEAKRANSKENVSFGISKPAPVVYFLQQSHIS